MTFEPIEPKYLDMLPAPKDYENRPKPIIEKNFLTPEEHKHLFDLLLSNGLFPLFYNCGVGYKGEKDFYFFHNIFDATRGWVGVESGIDAIMPILKKMDIKALLRIKINFFTKTEKIQKHSPHIDFPYECKTALFYVNDNDGYTGFADGTKIPSKGNSLVHFDAGIPHYSTTCTDENLRCNINFNYF